MLAQDVLYYAIMTVGTKLNSDMKNFIIYATKLTKTQFHSVGLINPLKQLHVT